MASACKRGRAHWAGRAILASVSPIVSLPRITPEIPTLVPPFHRDGWIYEEKIDGWRIVAYKAGRTVQLLSRTGNDHTKRFAGVAQAIAALKPRTLILDGEVAVFDERLLSRFDLIGTDSATSEVIITPPVFMAFDCVYRNGRATCLDRGPLESGKMKR